MTLATFLIVLGLTLLAVGVALPIAYGIRLRAAARPSPRNAGPAPGAYASAQAR